MPEIDAARVRVTPECFTRWTAESDRHVWLEADGTIKTTGECVAFSDDRQRLRFTCDIREGFTVFLTADPHEWRLDGV